MSSYTRKEINNILDKISHMKYISRYYLNSNTIEYEKIHKRKNNRIYCNYPITEDIYVICECTDQNKMGVSFNIVSNVLSFNIRDIFYINDNTPYSITISIKDNKKLAINCIVFNNSKLMFIYYHIRSFLKKIFKNNINFNNEKVNK